MKKTITTLISIASDWRASQVDRPHCQVKGIVLINADGEVYGWKNELRNPECECPGSFAVTTDNRIFLASGGDYYNGAKEWVNICEDVDVSLLGDDTINT